MLPGRSGLSGAPFLMASQLSDLYRQIHRCGEELLALLGGALGDAELDRLETLLGQREQLTGEAGRLRLSGAEAPGLEALLQQQGQLEAALRRHLSAQQAEMSEAAARRSQVREFHRFIAPGGRSSMLDQRR